MPKSRVGESWPRADVEEDLLGDSWEEHQGRAKPTQQINHPGASGSGHPKQEAVLICTSGSLSDNSRSAEGTSSSILNPKKAINSYDLAMLHNFKKRERKPDNFTEKKKINYFSLSFLSAFHSLPQPLRPPVGTRWSPPDQLVSKDADVEKQNDTSTSVTSADTLSRNPHQPFCRCFAFVVLGTCLSGGSGELKQNKLL